jgi:DNA-binding XRE family transcriptional regulator
VRIRRLREIGLCLSQDDFATALGFVKRTVGNAERGVHPPSLALCRALDQALEKASDAQRDRFLAALVSAQTANQAIPAFRDRDIAWPPHSTGCAVPCSAGRSQCGWT